MTKVRALGTGGGLQLGDNSNFSPNYDPLTTSMKFLQTPAAPNTLTAFQDFGVIPYDYGGLQVQMRITGGSARALIDIGYGATAAEAAQNIIVPGFSHEKSEAIDTKLFNVRVPSGARLWVRGQSNAASLSTRIALRGYRGLPFGYASFRRGLSYGMTPATTQGVLFDAGAVANTLTAYQDFTAGCTDPIRQIFVNHFRNGGPTANTSLLITIARFDVILAAYVPLFTYQVFNPNAQFVSESVIGPFPVGLPVGTRLGAAIQADTTNAGGRTIGLGLLTFG